MVQKVSESGNHGQRYSSCSVVFMPFTCLLREMAEKLGMQIERESMRKKILCEIHSQKNKLCILHM